MWIIVAAISGLIGVAAGDTEKDAEQLADKLVHLRVFPDDRGVMNRSLLDTGGTLGIVVRGGKPHILVHLPGSKAAGMNLDPKLLQLAEVIR